MRPIIVLVTSGKNDMVDFVRVKLFGNEEDALRYCSLTTDEVKDKEYWTFAEIITEDYEYEIYRYENL